MIYGRLKGKGLKLLHHYPDQLWGMGDKSVPNAGFTPARILPPGSKRQRTSAPAAAVVKVSGFSDVIEHNDDEHNAVESGSYVPLWNGPSACASPDIFHSRDNEYIKVSGKSRVTKIISNFILLAHARVGTTHCQFEVRCGNTQYYATVIRSFLRQSGAMCKALSTADVSCLYWGTSEDWSHIMALVEKAFPSLPTYRLLSQIGKVFNDLLVLSDTLQIRRDPTTAKWEQNFCTFRETGAVIILNTTDEQDKIMWSFTPTPASLQIGASDALQKLITCNARLWASGINVASSFLCQSHSVMSLYITDLTCGVKSHFPGLKATAAPGANKTTSILVGHSLVYPFWRGRMPLYLENCADINHVYIHLSRARNMPIAIADANLIAGDRLANLQKKISDDGVLGAQFVGNPRKDKDKVGGSVRRTFPLQFIANSTQDPEFDKEMGDDMECLYRCLPLWLQMGDDAMQARTAVFTQYADLINKAGNQSTDFGNALVFGLAYGRLIGQTEEFVLTQFNALLEMILKAQKDETPAVADDTLLKRYLTCLNALALDDKFAYAKKSTYLQEGILLIYLQEETDDAIFAQGKLTRVELSRAASTLMNKTAPVSGRRPRMNNSSGKSCLCCTIPYHFVLEHLNE